MRIPRGSAERGLGAIALLPRISRTTSPFASAQGDVALDPSSNHYRIKVLRLEVKAYCLNVQNDGYLLRILQEAKFH